MGVNLKHHVGNLKIEPPYFSPAISFPYASSEQITFRVLEKAKSLVVNLSTSRRQALCYLPFWHFLLIGRCPYFVHNKIILFSHLITKMLLKTIHILQFVLMSGKLYLLVDYQSIPKALEKILSLLFFCEFSCMLPYRK